MYSQWARGPRSVFFGWDGLQSGHGNPVVGFRILDSAESFSVGFIINANRKVPLLRLWRHASDEQELLIDYDLSHLFKLHKHETSESMNFQRYEKTQGQHWYLSTSSRLINGVRVVSKCFLSGLLFLQDFCIYYEAHRPSL